MPHSWQNFAGVGAARAAGIGGPLSLLIFSLFPKWVTLLAGWFVPELNNEGNDAGVLAVSSTGVPEFLGW